MTWADTTQLTLDDAEFESVDVSRDGRLLVSSDRGGSWDVWMLPAAGGELHQLTTDPGVDVGPRWKPDRTQVCFIGRGARANNVWTVSIGSRKERAVTALTGWRGVLGLLALAVDARYLYFAWEERRGDIWVAEIGPPPGR